MKISLNWLKRFIDLKKSPKEISDILTETGLEVDTIEDYQIQKSKIDNLVIGEIKSLLKHPNSENLQIAKVNIGEKNLNIVCGAPNIKKNQKVIVAKEGITIYPVEGKKIKIKKAKIGGVNSEGMICSEKEIGISNDDTEVIILKNNKIINGSRAYKYLNPLEDVIFDISLTPNRIDAASHLGVARDLKAIIKSKINLPKISSFSIDKKNLKIEVKVQNNNACPRYSGILISKVKVDDSPKWLQHNLRSIGLTPINNVVDITNYVLHSFGQPLHAFDYNSIKSKRIEVKFLKKGTKFTTLDGVKRSLHSDDLMICDNNTPLCIAGVFGGYSSGVTNKTRNIFLESAYFSPEKIRKSSQNHQLKTDASFRFERGTDPNMTIYSLKIASIMIKKLTGGTIASEIIDIYPKKIEKTKIKVNIHRINKLIGSEIPKREIINILNSLDIICNTINNNLIEVSIPSYRVDVNREADLIEEILRIYGYNKIKLSRHLGTDFLSQPSQTSKEDDFSKKIMNLLISSGYYEINTNSLTTTDYVNKKNLWNKSESIEMINKLSEEHGVLKTNLLFTGLETIKYNLNHKQKNLKFFELDKDYKKEKNIYIEDKKLGIYLVGKNSENHFSLESKDVNIYNLKNVVHKVLIKSEINDYKENKFSDNFFDYGIIIEKNNIQIAKIGEINKEIKSLYDIKEKVFFAEISWNKILNLSRKNLYYSPVSKYPEVKRDLSLIIDKSVKFKEIKRLVEKNNYNVIKKISLYDIYQGTNIDKNKKAYAIRFILQDDKETLNDKKINHIMGKLMNTFIGELRAEIRK